jgi:hypothetical protein
MPKDRDQLTPTEPEDAEHLASHRGQGTAGSGHDRLADAEGDAEVVEGPAGTAPSADEEP